MSLIEIALPRRAHSKTPAPSYHPVVEILEARECLSVAAPTGLAAVAQSTTQVKLTWNNVAGEQSFRIYRWDGVAATVAGNVGRDVTTFTVTGLQAKTAYFFCVEARDFTTSARSAWVSISTPANPIAVPTNVRVSSITQTALTVQWNNAAGAIGYRVYRWDGTNAYLLGTTTPSVPALRVLNLSPGTVYYFFVQAFNKTNTANSNSVTATTLANGITPPGNFRTQSVNASTIGLAWNNVLSATGYKIFQWNGMNNSSAIQIATLGANTTGYQATGLLPGTNYWFYIQAFNATSFANTPWVKGTTVAAAPLQAPSQVTIQVTGPGAVKLTWVEPARAVGFRVYQWTGFSWNVAATVTAGTHSVSLSGLMTNFTHWFVIQAFTTNNAEVAASTAVFANL